MLTADVARSNVIALSLLGEHWPLSLLGDLVLVLTRVSIRCQKGGVAEKCKYVPYEDDEESLNDDRAGARESSLHSWDEEANDYARIAAHGVTSAILAAPALHHKKPTQADTISRLEQKIADLEYRLEPGRSNAFTSYYVGLPTPASTTMTEPSLKSSLPSMEQTLLRGKSFKTQYYGPSHYASILLSFDELSRFLKDVMNFFNGSMCANLRSTTDTKFKTMRQDLEDRCHAQPHNHDALLALFPERSVLDAHLQQYLESFETTYRVLHVPTILSQYETFWQQPQQSPTSFLVVLLLVMACVHCVSSDEPNSFFGRSTKKRERAAMWISVSEAWLEEQSYKHVSLVTYQIRVLIFLAKRVNSIKIKRAWPSAGYLVRLAMGAGFHREPDSEAGKVSVFDQEMRRRLWATILELELMTAADKGMPPSIHAGDWDCGPPSNIYDEELEASSSSLPPSRPANEFTRTSYLHVSAQSSALRVEMLSKINAVKPSLTADIAAQYDIRIRQALAEIPNWRWDAVHISGPDPRLARALAQLQLIEYTVMLYQPLATSTESAARTFFSRAAFRDASAHILEIYKRLEESRADILRFVRNDSFRAGLCICYDICTESVSSSSVTFNRERAMELLEHALQIQEARVLQIGQGFHAFWITSSALSLCYSKLQPEQSPRDFAEAGAKRVRAMNDKIVAFQEFNIDDVKSFGPSTVLSSDLGSSSCTCNADCDAGWS